MPRLSLSLAFALLLAVSLGLKVQLGSATSFGAQYPDGEDIEALMAKHAFVVTPPEPDTDPQWFTGVQGGCVIKIANVSPQGWHRAAVEWKAGDDPILYAAGAALHDRQPIAGPLLRYYLRRFERYAGIDAPPLKVRAIIRSGECPDSLIAPAELAALSD
ncbi:hypothetical protein ASD64_06415 [Mesorhizobium sp. Root157]|uniref:hypothetical protein n=1 Tax=Mesorhizobium sp. Root157 TaxID=1736477 RepID=UPI0006F38ED6|nr:hypothetical protein [Mesorhizobium sp. Root157]KQZ87079.1 hypothetical protein ASD64_06415 [Mesorhizobium sp. Root157]